MTRPVLWNYDLDDASYTVRLMASLAGVDVDLRAVDVYPGAEHHSPGYLARHPLGRVPLLEDGVVQLRQVPAMLTHLARTGPRGTGFLPADPVGTAAVEDWLAFAFRDWLALSAARSASIFGDGVDLDPLRAAATAALRVAEDRLVAQSLLGSGFVAGSAASVADIALFPGFALSRDSNIDHDAFPALRNWARRIRALEGFVTMPGIPDYH